jgi:hypothetical protein
MGWFNKMFPIGSTLDVPVNLRYKHAQEAIEHAINSSSQNNKQITLVYTVIDKIEKLLETSPKYTDGDFKQLQKDMAWVHIDALDSRSKEKFNALNAQLGRLALK